jgi:nicotinamidase-related amidase
MIGGRGFILIDKCLALFLLTAALSSASDVPLNLRTREESPAASGQWQEQSTTRNIDPKRTAIVICDMWDKHWCRGATNRVNLLVPKMKPVLDAARKSGVLIIHAPSDTMDYYAAAPQRKRMMNLPPADLPESRELTSPPLPIDDSDGGCDTPGDTEHKAWKREHPGIRIAGEDYISDNGEEVYRLLRQRGIQQLLVMGVHTNMCILNRTFAIKQMTNWGVPCILVRDLTDAMYDPADAPHVSHQQGTELVIEYIEKYWAPTTTSDDLLRALHQ